MNFSVRLLHTIQHHNIQCKFFISSHWIEFCLVFFFALISANDNNQCHLLPTQSEQMSNWVWSSKEKGNSFSTWSIECSFVVVSFFLVCFTRQTGNRGSRPNQINMFWNILLCFSLCIVQEIATLYNYCYGFLWIPFDFSITGMAFNLDGWMACFVAVTGGL